jgi:lipid-binding SYLF domain-containing protein
MFANFQHSTRRSAIVATGVAMLALAVPTLASAETAAEIRERSVAALKTLYATDAKAAAIGKKAAGVLIFPKIVKGGFVISGSSGNGALIVNKQVRKYYNFSSASFGLEAGVQGYGYALFLMNPSALASAQKNESWDVGSDPNVVALDKGGLAELDTRSLDKGVYAFAFGQKGLMAGISLKGARTKEIHPKPD